jgi:hypothetical protein
MGYDLYLRGKTPEAAVDRAKLEAALRAAGATDKDGAFSLPVGQGRCRAQLTATGMDLEMPFGAPEADFRAALLQAAELGARLELTLMDPQRGAEVTPASAEATVQTWIKANRYAVDTAGLVEDVRNALPIEPPKSQWNAKSKVLLALIALVVLAYEVLMLSLSLFTTPPRPID